MWSDALILFRKEAGNVLRDRGAVFANYLLPLVLMPLIFGVLGSINKVQEDSHRQTVYHLAFAGGRECWPRACSLSATWPLETLLASR